MKKILFITILSLILCFNLTNESLSTKANINNNQIVVTGNDTVRRGESTLFTASVNNGLNAADYNGFFVWSINMVPQTNQKNYTYNFTTTFTTELGAKFITAEIVGVPGVSFSVGFLIVTVNTITNLKILANDFLFLGNDLELVVESDNGTRASDYNGHYVWKINGDVQLAQNYIFRFKPENIGILVISVDIYLGSGNNLFIGGNKQVNVVNYLDIELNGNDIVEKGGSIEFTTKIADGSINPVIFDGKYIWKIDNQVQTQKNSTFIYETNSSTQLEGKIVSVNISQHDSYFFIETSKAFHVFESIQFTIDGDDDVVYGNQISLSTKLNNNNNPNIYNGKYIWKVDGEIIQDAKNNIFVYNTLNKTIGNKLISVEIENFDYYIFKTGFKNVLIYEHNRDYMFLKSSNTNNVVNRGDTIVITAISHNDSSLKEYNGYFIWTFNGIDLDQKDDVFYFNPSANYNLGYYNISARIDSKFYSTSVISITIAVKTIFDLSIHGNISPNPDSPTEFNYGIVFGFGDEFRPYSNEIIWHIEYTRNEINYQEISTGRSRTITPLFEQVYYVRILTSFTSDNLAEIRSNVIFKSSTYPRYD